MMKVGVIGIDFHQSPLEIREKAALFVQKHLFIESVVVTTCNRTEIYSSSPALISQLEPIFAEFSQGSREGFYKHFDEDCFLHLASVTAGLKSALFGETEIQGQVKTSYLKACEQDFLSKDLHFLFQKSLRIGKQIRKEIPLEKERLNLEDIIWEIGTRFFQDPKKAKVLFIGASEINQKLIHGLKLRGVQEIAICNRTDSIATSLATDQDLFQEQFAHRGRWLDYDWVFAGTKAPFYLMRDEEAHNQLGNKKLLIDLGVPRNIDPKLGHRPEVLLCNIDDVSEKEEEGHPLRAAALHLAYKLTQRQLAIFERKEFSILQKSACPG